MDEKIENVSDTALWVATYRAEETERPDALFKDPLAGVLAGERGRRIAASMPHGKVMAWVMTVRTVAIDRLIQEAVAQGIDTVINLGTGLDTRPYRMPLPESLHWIEVDFPHIIELKNRKLGNEKPRCQLERIALDLSNKEARRALFERLNANAKKALIITEGVLSYLDEAAVISLARDLRAQPHFAFWIQDYYEGELKVPKSWSRKLASAPLKLHVEQWFPFFEKLGWGSRSVIYAGDEGKRIGRPLPFLFWLLMLLVPRKKKELYRKQRGYVLLEASSRS